MARSLPNPSPDLASLLESWQLAMRGERKSPNTIAMYSDGVKAFLRWCESTGTPAELTKPNVQAFLADLIDAGAEGATAYARHKGLRRFAVWLTDEGELAENPLLGSKAPKVDRKVVEALTDEQLQALLKTCKGNTIAHRRDEAILRLCMETGARAGEVIGMTVADIDLQHGLVTIRRGKGGKGRVVPISAQAAAAMDRYVRIRRTHKLADTGPLWVGGRGGTFGYHALNVSMKKRADAAGITGFHLHKLRHTAATRWLRKGGSEQGLMAVAGWSTRSMLDRYTGASAAERAASEARTLDLGEL